jgi:hypothetical protein
MAVIRLGHPVVVRRGNRQVIMQAIEPSDSAGKEAEFNAALPPAPREPRGTAARIGL